VDFFVSICCNLLISELNATDGYCPAKAIDRIYLTLDSLMLEGEHDGLC
jgi:hypothetical protein